MLELKHVDFAYPGGRRVIQDLSLNLERGTSLGIMGENGSGKTTVAHLMCGLLVPDGGRVLVDGVGTDVSDRIHEVRKRVGIVFQDPDEQLIETTVEREIGFGLRNLGLEPAEVAGRTDEALAVFGIDHLRKRSCHLLSAGEKQTVTVASIFAMEPDYVVLDESTSLLDPGSRLRLVAAVERLIRETGAGLVFISMRLEDLWMCDRVALLADGSVGYLGGKVGLAGRLGGGESPLPGLGYLLGVMEEALPGLGEQVALSRILSAQTVFDAIGRVTEDRGGEAACR